MAKLIIRGGAFQPNDTAEKLANVLSEYATELEEVVGSDLVTDTNGRVRKVAQNPQKVDQDIKKRLVENAGFIFSALQAPKGVGAAGRASKADLAVLERLYVETARNNPTWAKSKLSMMVALSYNESHGGDSEIDQLYVQRQASAKEWDQLITVPVA